MLFKKSLLSNLGTKAHEDAKLSRHQTAEQTMAAFEKVCLDNSL
jgi:hypothetical protein